MEKQVMTVKEMAQVMQLSLPKAYDLTNRADFPIIHVGRKKLIPIHAFNTWLKKQTGQGGVSE